ncbi:MAG: hypothetical protein QNJ58_02035 [Desulfobacterales bacterium]|nr:hypothetical protein [Desulfobacterales bacterium]
MPTRWTIPTEVSRQLFKKRRDYLSNLCSRLGAEHDFTFDDWEILFHVLENYLPDYIFEVGRGAGNTTCVFLEHCRRHSAVEFLSLDLYDHWNLFTTDRLPEDFLDKNGGYKLLRQNFLDSDIEIEQIIKGNWNRLFLFWDVNDVDATKYLTTNMLPYLGNRNTLFALHDVGHKTGRPRRYHWRDYESLYQDFEVIGKFLDLYDWPAAIPSTETIFGQYRNAGHWLLCESTAKS